MDVQSLLNRISFLEDEVHRCYAEIEKKEVKIEAYEDALAVDETATLAKIYKKYRNWSDEDLIEEIQDLTDKRLAIIFNFPLDYRVDVKQHILD